MPMHRYSGIAILAGVLAFSSCQRTEPNYCPTARNHNCMELDALPPGCLGDQDCSGATPVCDVTGTQTCLQCTAAKADACTGTTPLCGADNTCQPCTAHTQCASSACLPDGACAAETMVAYVASSGSGKMCTKTNPCSTLEDALAKDLPIVKIAAGDVVKGKQTAMISGRVLTIVADPGAKLDRDGDGPIIQVQSVGADVSIFDLEITGASGTAGGDGIDLVPNGGAPKLTLTRVTIDVNQGVGISSTGGTLIVTQSTLSGNTGGGVSITGSQYQFINNFIVNNGGPTNAFGGVLIGQITVGGTHVFQFNTITGNVAAGTNTAGVLCSAVALPLNFANSVIFQNASPAQVDGTNCTWTYSDVGPLSVPGTGNINIDPMFAAPVQGNFHLMNASPARRAADPMAALTGLAAKDFDGDTRVSPADMGADQVK
jgi:hypothetical protein